MVKFLGAGCFGCLALVFLAFILVTSFYAAIPGLEEQIGPILQEQGGGIQAVNWGCCCISAALAFVFLAAGVMGRKKDAYE